MSKALVLGVAALALSAGAASAQVVYPGYGYAPSYGYGYAGYNGYAAVPIKTPMSCVSVLAPVSG
jgi:hypothetical protein